MLRELIARWWFIQLNIGRKANVGVSHFDVIHPSLLKHTGSLITVQIILNYYRLPVEQAI